MKNKTIKQTNKQKRKVLVATGTTPFLESNELCYKIPIKCVFIRF